MMSIKHFFDEVAEHYWPDDLVFDSRAHFGRIKRIASPWMVGDVADIGSGGLLHFDPALPERIILVDISTKMLRTPRTIVDGRYVPVAQNKIARTVGNACRVPLRDESLDSVIIGNVIHHLSVASLKETKVRVKTALDQIRRVLRPGGHFVIIENCPSLLFGSIYRWAYPILYGPFEWWGKPLPYFFSQHSILQFLAEVGLSVNEMHVVEWGRRLYVPLFPGFHPPGKVWACVIRPFMFIGKKVSCDECY